jgi:hypothetical protein
MKLLRLSCLALPLLALSAQASVLNSANAFGILGASAVTNTGPNRENLVRFGGEGQSRRHSQKGRKHGIYDQLLRCDQWILVLVHCGASLCQHV